MIIILYLFDFAEFRHRYSLKGTVYTNRLQVENLEPEGASYRIVF
jgi:hypothetical protein